MEEQAKPWYGKVIFEREGVYTEKKYNSKEQAMAFVEGFMAAKHISEQDDEYDTLEEYYADFTQTESVDE